MDLHPELERVLNLALNFWLWGLGSLIFLVLIRWILYRFWPSPYDSVSLKEKRKEAYHAGNVKKKTVYHVWCSVYQQQEFHQEFIVLRISGRHMLVAVFSSGWRLKPRSKRFAFRGWTEAIPHDQLINQSDLKSSPPRPSPFDRLLATRMN